VEIFFKTLFKKGAKGDKGDDGVSYEVPTGAIIGYAGTDIPEGYVETTAPKGWGAEITQLQINNKIVIQNILTARGEII
jgi:hypothetical protein